MYSPSAKRVFIFLFRIQRSRQFSLSCSPSPLCGSYASRHLFGSQSEPYCCGFRFPCL